MEAPKSMTFRWVDGETGEEYGRAKYIRADAPELVELVEAMRGIAEAGQYASGRDMGEIAQNALSAWESLTNE